ncbi:MAG: radical SAM protein [Alphaproteobacteria bacterium]|nr:radical SAM protein [Alphaproteobacteria bacterium]
MKYKEFELIMSSFKCDKNCPYCTAKITQWPTVDNHLELLPERLKYLRDLGISFRYFILSGNGEPSLYDYETLQTILNATKQVDIFDERRLQTSGNLFFDDKKFNLMKDDFMLEVTRTDFDSAIDMQTLGYRRDYIHSKNFQHANIRLNYVMLKGKTFDEYIREIKRYINTYPNIKTVSLKTLNTNTRNSDVSNPRSQWILQHALTKADSNQIIHKMSEITQPIVKDEEFFDRYEWIYNGIPITFYTKKLDYGYSNIVYYGGNLVDYKLNPIKLKMEKSR